MAARRSRAAIQFGKRVLHHGLFVARAECSEDIAGLTEQLPGGHGITGAPKQPGARCQRLSEVITRSDRLENVYCLLDVFPGRAGIVRTKAVADQPTR